jgi:hypothetical protein
VKHNKTILAAHEWYLGVGYYMGCCSLTCQGLL